MKFLLIFAFMVLAQNNNGAESCNVVKKELQLYPEGTYVKSNDIFLLTGCQNPVPACAIFEKSSDPFIFFLHSNA